MSKLSGGKSSLSINNVPIQKIGLTTTEKFQTKSFRLTIECIEAIDQLSERFSNEAGFTIARGKIIELAISQIKSLSLKDLLED